MRAHKKLPDVAVLHATFNYNSKTGWLTWQEKKQGRKHDRAGSLLPRGYRSVLCCGVSWQEHRIIWCLVTGEDPGDYEIDHRNGVGNDNRWSNLRKATRSQQTINTPSNPRNTSGYRGVWQRPSGRYCAQIKIGGRGAKTTVIGTFNTAEEASVAYKKVAQELHGEYRREELHA